MHTAQAGLVSWGALPGPELLQEMKSPRSVAEYTEATGKFHQHSFYSNAATVRANRAFHPQRIFFFFFFTIVSAAAFEV